MLLRTMHRGLSSLVRPACSSLAATGMSRRIGAASAAAAAAAAPSRLSGARSLAKGKLSSGKLYRSTYCFCVAAGRNC